jgi:hypothetical protein
MVWGVKGTGCLPLLILHAFYKHKVSLALQRAHVISILKHVIVISEGSSRLNVLSRVLPLSLFDMLLATRGVQELDVP